MGQKLHETTIRIRGTAYQLRTDMENDRLQELAEYVDDTMKDLDPRSSLPPGKLSVLASLSLAGELFDEKKKTDSYRGVEKRLERMATMLDAALDGAAGD